MIQALASSFSSENGLNCIFHAFTDEIESEDTDLKISHFMTGEPRQ